MSALLDTHVLLWLLDESPRLGTETIGWLRRQPRVQVSTASLWEIAIKQDVGKLRVPTGLPELITASGLAWLPIEAEHAWATITITGLPHRDPFDRMLLAQACYENLTLVTADTAILTAPVEPTVRLRDATT